MERHTKKKGWDPDRVDFAGVIPGNQADDSVRPICDWPGCVDQGAHRAPRSRKKLRVYHWFCLEHVRLFNKSWNYYQGMSEDEVEASRRSDVTWNRPTWPLGAQAGGQAKKNHWFGAGSVNMGDPFGIMGQDAGPERADHPPVARAEDRALCVLDLEFPVTVEDVKARYKLLVKRHHPDVNGGDKAAEEKLKQINQAYETVINRLAS